MFESAIEFTSLRDPSVSTRNVSINASGAMYIDQAYNIDNVDVRPASNHRRNKIPRRRYRYTYASRR